MTVDSFSGNPGTTGPFYLSARFRFGESSDNDRERLRHFLRGLFVAMPIGFPQLFSAFLSEANSLTLRKTDAKNRFVDVMNPQAN